MPAAGVDVHVLVVTARDTRGLARATAASVRTGWPAVPLHVVDVDGTYPRAAGEHLVPLGDLGLDGAAVRRRGAATTLDRLRRAVEPIAVRTVLRGHGDRVVVVVRPGVVLLGPHEDLASGAGATGLALVSRAGAPLPDDGRWPDRGDIAHEGAWSSSLIAVGAGHDGVLEAWTDAAIDPTQPEHRWLDVVASEYPYAAVRDPAALLGPASLRRQHVVSRDDRGVLLLDGRPVLALDLSRTGPSTPWVLDAAPGPRPRALLSEHPVLADEVARFLRLAADVLPPPDGSTDLTMTSLGVPPDGVVRTAFATLAGEVPPDPFEPDQSGELLAWLAEPVAPSGLPRWLLALHRSRADLRHAYPRVPGRDQEGLLGWVRHRAVAEGHPAVVVDAVLAASEASPLQDTAAEPEPPVGDVDVGLNVVGFLRGELGIGESARLVVAALEASDVPYSTVAVEENLVSRQNARYAAGTDRTYGATLVCVNADMTGTVAAAVPELFAGTLRIGMWYWEVESFPPSQHVGFDNVDEVWVATEFVRGAVEPHSPVPVRTVTPPLPQRGPEPTRSRVDLGLPQDRTVFLFSFDHLSTTERKNPVGLVDAFTKAFGPDEGAVLVIKSINGDLRPVEAERLRLHAAPHPHVRLMEEYLEAADRDALVALSDVYVSLHRSEGLGLTMAEAMSWGKPVIATGYSGNMQFMTEENAYLVPYRLVPIPPGADPYPAGTLWAEPDLEAAAALMRRVMTDPGGAAARGRRAALDIARLHSPGAAGVRIRDALDAALEEDRQRRTPPPPPPPPTRRARLRRRVSAVLRRITS